VEPSTTPWPLIRTTSRALCQHGPRKPTDSLHPCSFASSKINLLMSAPTSPRASSESAERPELKDQDHTIPPAGSGHTRSPSGEAKPKSKRRSIQFSVGAAEAQLPSRSLSFKEKRVSYGGTPTRELLEEKEREHKATALNRGPSPPPPKYVLLEDCV
jgi:hypothetical protein